MIGPLSLSPSVVALGRRPLKTEQRDTTKISKVVPRSRRTDVIVHVEGGGNTCRRRVAVAGQFEVSSVMGWSDLSSFLVFLLMFTTRRTSSTAAAASSSSASFQTLESQMMSEDFGKSNRCFVSLETYFRYHLNKSRKWENFLTLTTLLTTNKCRVNRVGLMTCQCEHVTGAQRSASKTETGSCAEFKLNSTEQKTYVSSFSAWRLFAS